MATNNITTPSSEIGKRYGKLTVMAYSHANEHHQRFWECICDCGNRHVTQQASLRNGFCLSCGCISLEREYRPKYTYMAWSSMKSRCHNPKASNYHNYGARGIVVCDRWRNSFANFLADMGEKPKTCSMERIDNSGNYEPGNCRWATNKDQANNKRTNINLTFDGQTMTMKQWAEKLGINYRTLTSRIRSGFEIRRAITEQPRDYTFLKR